MDAGEKGAVEGEMREETADEKAYREYYEYYQSYYSGQPEGATTTPVDSEQQEFDEWAYYNYYYGGEEGEGEKGEGEEGECEQEEDEDDEEEAKSKKKKRKLEEKKTEGWFEIEAEKNTNVYVTGLPDDITDDEFKELMAKCGMITLDPRGREYKLKLYRDKDGKPKGDGLCCYMKSESVGLALQMLDEYDVRGHRISVEVAQFEMKGKFDPKKRKKLSNKERKNIKKQQQKLLDWRPNKPLGYRPKHERIIIVKNAFNYKDFEEDPKRIQILREELRAQCVNFGTVKKVIVYDRHQEGVVSVAFDEVSEGDLAIESLNGRFFNKRQITAEAWDGKSKFEVKETEAEREARLKQWETFLEADENKEEEGKKAVKKAGGTKAQKRKKEKAVADAEKHKLESGSGTNTNADIAIVVVKGDDDNMDCTPSDDDCDAKQPDPKDSSVPPPEPMDNDQDLTESKSEISTKASSTVSEGVVEKDEAGTVESADSGSVHTETSLPDKADAETLMET